MTRNLLQRYRYRLAPVLLGLLSASAFVTFLIQAQDPNQTQARPDNGKKKGPGTPVVNARELPIDVTPATMETLRMSLGVECAYCHVSGEFLERGHNGDRQSDQNPHKLIARDMIKMTKEINRALTGVGVFPDPTNVVTCWTCHRGNRRPPAGAPPIAPASAPIN